MHRIFWKYIVIFVVVPGLLLGVEFGAIAAGPAARPMDAGTITAPDSSYSIPENTTWTAPAGVLLTGATDTDPTGTCCTAALDAQATNGTATLDSNGDGGFSYTPNSGFTGTDSFTYLLTDSDGNVSADVTVSMVVGTPTPTRVTIISEDPPATGPGDPVSFEAEVKDTAGGGAPAGGSVIFTFYTVGVANCGPASGTLGSAPVNSGEATLSTMYPSNPCDAGGPNNGSITVDATYIGDTNDAASISSIPYYVLVGCTLGPWPPISDGYPSILAGGPEGYYVGQSNGWYTLYMTQPTGDAVKFTGSVTTSNGSHTGLILDVSSLKNETKDKVTLVGSDEITFKIVNHGDLDGFSFFAGCGNELRFTLDIGKTAAPATKKQIFIGADSAKSPTFGEVEFARL